MTSTISRNDLIDVPERRAVAQAFEVRSAGNNIARITGYASVFNQGYDVHGGPATGGWTERVMPGAFKRTLAETPHVHLLINHEGLPLASTKSKTLRLSTDSTGLITEAEVDRRNTRANDMILTLERGDVDEMSFAFRVKGQSWSDNGDTRSLDEVSLHKGDVSVVSFGANPFTSVGVRSAIRALASGNLGPKQLAEIRAMSDEVDLAMHALRAARADKEPYGNVDYADPGFQKDGQKRYPLSSAAKVRSAWSYINVASNAAVYTAAQLAHIKREIKAAAKHYGIDIDGGQKSLRAESNPQKLIAGLDAVLDEAADLTEGVDRDGLPEPVGQALDLLVAAQGVVGQLMGWLGIFDPDHPEANSLRSLPPNIITGNQTAFVKAVHDMAVTAGANCDSDGVVAAPMRALSPMLDDDSDGLEPSYPDSDGSNGGGSLAQAVHDLVADAAHEGDDVGSTVDPDDDGPYLGRNFTVAGAVRASGSAGNLSLNEAVRMCRPDDSPEPLSLAQALNLSV